VEMRDQGGRDVQPMEWILSERPGRTTTPQRIQCLAHGALILEVKQRVDGLAKPPGPERQYQDEKPPGYEDQLDRHQTDGIAAAIKRSLDWCPTSGQKPPADSIPHLVLAGMQPNLENEPVPPYDWEGTDQRPRRCSSPGGYPEKNTGQEQTGAEP
jgi:hypothetical protein